MPVDQADTASHPDTSRRRFFQTAIAGASMLAMGGLASAATSIPPTQGLRSTPSVARDQDIMNFALNLEYLGAEFYLRATTGQGLTIEDSGSDDPGLGQTIGGRKINFTTDVARGLAEELARDELGHLRVLRLATVRSIARPSIDLENSFTAAARAAGLIGATETFDVFANENNFLLGAFMLEDVCVTALKGAAPLLYEKKVIDTAAGLLGTEGYHAGSIRSLLFARGLGAKTKALSDLRDSVDGPTDLDQPVINDDGTANLVPTDANGLVFARTPGQVLAIAYLSPTAESGGFFPNGVNGRIH